MNKEKIDEILRPKYINLTGEDIDSEAVYHDNNRRAISTAIEEGRMDPEILTEDILAKFISDGIDFVAYDEMVKKYCMENNIDYDEYVSDRDKTVAENREKKSKETAEKKERWDKAKQIEKALKSEYGYEFIEDLRKDYTSIEDYHDYLITEYGEEYLATDEMEDYELDEEEIENFMGNAANEAELPENVNTKNNWMNRIKDWIKDKVNSIKNTFQR